MAATISITISTGSGTFPPSIIMQLAVASTPIMTWPSPPMFQKRIRKAGAIAREMIRRIDTFCKSTHSLLSEAKLPSQIVRKTLSGSSPVRRKVTSAQTRIESTIAPARIAVASFREMSGRFTIWAIGPFFFSFISPHLLRALSSCCRPDTCLSSGHPECRKPFRRTGQESGPPAPEERPDPRRHR